MKVILTGATGMVGKGVLYECLDDPSVEQVLSISRSPCGMSNPKLKELLLKDLNDYSGVEEQLKGYDACFFCLGVSSAGMNEADYTKVTYDLTLALAKALVKVSPQATFIYVSGQGTDSTEKGGSMWARVKGRVENELLKLGFKGAYMFRPGLIIAKRGIKSRTALYRTFYAIGTPLWPLVESAFPKAVTNTDKVGKAMIKVAIKGFPSKYLENREINTVASA
ncbi:MAG: NAD(P)H-binding protein [Myxococcaceae bacterium]